MKRRILSIVLAICMVFTLVPTAAFAAADTDSTPSVATYATKAQLMDGTFAPDSSGNAANIGKLVFGKKSDGVTPQEWYILGKDTGVSGENTIIFAANSIKNESGELGNVLAFELDSDVNKTDPTLWADCKYDNSPSEVYQNHYGASKLRDTLQEMATTNFTVAEQGIMNATTVTTKDTKNGVDYTTTDKLYALAADSSDPSSEPRNITVKAGSNDQIALAMDSYWKENIIGGGFWLRSPFNGVSEEYDIRKLALCASLHNYVWYNYVFGTYYVQPASNLDLSSVLFASSAVAASDLGTSDAVSTEPVFGRINKESNAEPQAMTLRMDGSGKSIGTVTYEPVSGEIKARQSVYASGIVSLVIQGKDGTDDWYYSKIIAGTETVKASDIQSALGLSAAIDLSSCKIWLENKDVRDKMIYAVNASKETPKTYFAYADKDQLMDGTFAPDSNGTAANIGKLTFGKNSSRQAQEWYILGEDTGVTGDNTMIFAASPIKSDQVFNESTENKTYKYEAGTGYSTSADSIDVYANHYGASELRKALNEMAASTSYFTAAEQGMMNATTVKTADIKNNLYYTTTDKLYALQGTMNETNVRAGRYDQIVLAMDSYWNSGSGVFWLRSPYRNPEHPENGALFANLGNYVDVGFVIGFTGPSRDPVRPAGNLNLSNVLFASAAEASSYGVAAGTITSGKAMTLRLAGSSKNIGSAIYNTKTGEIHAAKGNTNGTVSLVVQGNDGTNDWYYSIQLKGAATVYASDIQSKLGLSADIALPYCKIWLETTGEDGMIYAVNAEKEIEATHFTYATKEQLMDGTFAPNSEGTAVNIGKLVFGKKSDGEASQEWYVLGKDNGVDGDNTVLFAASPIATGGAFKKFTNEVYPNHYGESDLRKALNNMVKDENTTYFTPAEKSLIKATPVKTKDSNNNEYTTTDKLYALAVDSIGDIAIKAGSSNQKVLSMFSYWNDGNYVFWLRTPYNEQNMSPIDAFVAGTGGGVGFCGVDLASDMGIRPASNLDLSNVLFASSAVAAAKVVALEGVQEAARPEEELPAASGYIDSGTPMTIRLKAGKEIAIGTATYDLSTGEIRAQKAENASGAVSLVIQGKDRTGDWYYSKIITETETVKVSDIVAESNTPASIDLSSCKIWLETTGDDGMFYAVNAEDKDEKITTAYATKEQLMDGTFAPNSNGTAANIGKLAFGKNSSRQAQEWYILGKDTGVTGENTILFAASPIKSGQMFNSNSSNKTYNSTEVYANHYGASELCAALNDMAASTSYFTAAEQGMMNATTVTTKDIKNNKDYTTTGKLYALAADGIGATTIKAGNSNQTAFAMESYWNSEDIQNFWLRSPYADSNSSNSGVLFVSYDNLVERTDINSFGGAPLGAVQPAANLNLSSVLFASAATAATSSTEASYGTIAPGTAMTLRLGGNSKNIGTVNYNAAEGTIEGTRGYTSLPVALIVQGNDGINNWFYSQKLMHIGETEVVNASDIKTALGLSSDIDLSSCEVWLEAYSDPRDRGNGMIYAVNAGDTPINSDTYTPPAENVIVQNDDNATTSADLSNNILISDDVATAKVEPNVAEIILSKAVENKSKKIVIDALSKNQTEAAATVVAQVDVPTIFLEALAATTEADVNFKTNVAEVTMDNAAAGAVAKQAAGDTVQLIVEKVDETADKVEFQLKVVGSNGNEIHDFKGGKAAVTVSIPETMAEKEIVCVYIDDNGRMSKVTVQKNANGTYTFFTGHFSTYALMTAEEADDAIAAQNEAIQNINITLRSKQVKMKNGKKAIKLTWACDSDADFDGVEIYRSTKRYSGYGKKPIYTTTKDAYYNTAIKKGTKYYYKVRGYVEVEGEKIYTDWSTKAWRTVK
ncbi:MAG: DUF6273 domain-containing protein [Anaerovoracaceae bacterium]